MPGPRRLVRPPEPVPPAQVGDELALQHSPTLHIQTPVDRLVRHVELRIVRKGVDGRELAERRVSWS